jgi:para-aminobenzoate synthetase/4-amino-4-deoxychorismate lyase
VPQLFDVQRYASVLQMTSTVEAEVPQQTPLAEIFDALYPCGSITGAPKHRTMQIIRELESEPRGLYTGAIGWFEPPAEGQNGDDFCLSVPIRTLQLQPLGVNGVRRGVLGVGAGIVYDSTPADEFAECKLKASFLTGLKPDFELIETMHATREAGCRHLERHLQRLAGSARYFGFEYDEAAVRLALQQACAALEPQREYRMRLSLAADGTITLQNGVLLAMASPAKLLLASAPVDVPDIFLRHKTSVRATYDAAWREAEKQGAFDMLFVNRAGKVTEGGRSTLLVCVQGQWYTPPLSDGVLPGVMRSVMMDDPDWQVQEKSFTLDEVRRADKLMLCNALRGAFEVNLVG